MNVYRMNDCDWVAAETRNEAVEFYKGMTGCTDEELYEDDISELTQEELIDTDFMCEDRQTRECSFQEKLDIMIKEHEVFPCLFATTEF